MQRHLEHFHATTDRFGKIKEISPLESTVRPSLAFYNTCAEVDELVRVLHKLPRA